MNGRFPGSPRKVCLPKHIFHTQSGSVALTRLSIMRMTVAGTAQDLHLIPFSCKDETPMHHQFGCKGTQYFKNMQLF